MISYGCIISAKYSSLVRQKHKYRSTKEDYNYSVAGSQDPHSGNAHDTYKRQSSADWLGRRLLQKVLGKTGDDGTHRSEILGGPDVLEWKRRHASVSHHATKRNAVGAFQVDEMRPIPCSQAQLHLESPTSLRAWRWWSPCPTDSSNNMTQRHYSVTQMPQLKKGVAMERNEHMQVQSWLR